MMASLDSELLQHPQQFINTFTLGCSDTSYWPTFFSLSAQDLWLMVLFGSSLSVGSRPDKPGRMHHQPSTTTTFQASCMLVLDNWQTLTSDPLMSEKLVWLYSKVANEELLRLKYLTVSANFLEEIWKIGGGQLIPCGQSTNSSLA